MDLYYVWLIKLVIHEVIITRSSRERLESTLSSKQLQPA